MLEITVWIDILVTDFISDSLMIPSHAIRIQAYQVDFPAISPITCRSDSSLSSKVTSLCVHISNKMSKLIIDTD